MAMADHQQVTEFEQEWDLIKKITHKLINLLEGKSEQAITPEDYMSTYTAVYSISRADPYSSSRSPQGFVRQQQLYDRYRQSIEEYINDMVLPAIHDIQDEFMLRELVRRWDNHKVMVRWLSRFFNYLDRYFIPRLHLPCLGDVGLICFRDLVYQQVKLHVKEAVIVLINREREGGQIDRAELKNVLSIFVEIGMGGMHAYANDFESFMLEDTAQYYRRKAFSGIEAEECLKQEKGRAEHYLHASSEPKLLKVVSLEL